MSCYVILSHYSCILMCILKFWALWSFNVCWSMEARLKTKPLPQGFDGRDQVYLLVKKRKQTLDYNNLQPHPTACIIKATGLAPAPLLLCHDDCRDTLAAVVWWVIDEEFVDLLTMKFSEATEFPLPSGVTVGALASGDLKACDSAQRQYHVAITDIHGDLICGGSLINESWILSDASCYRWWERRIISVQCSLTGGLYTLADSVFVWLVRGMKVVLGGHPGPGRTIIINDPPVIDKDNSWMMLLKLPHPTKIEPVKLPACPHVL